jgi:4-amino-4-deoxy-L-arabinose transferase-like glycosyltransferase
MKLPRDQVLEMAYLAIFCAFFFFFGLGAFGLMGADEPRYAQVAREMLQRNDWVTPTLYGKVWLEKPVLYYWGAMASYWLFGVRDWAARVPSAAFATMMVFAIYFFMRWWRPMAGFSSALIACSSAAIFGFARGASTDMPLAATFTIAMLAWFVWWRSEEKRWLLVCYFFLAAATLAKGPVAPGLAALIVLLLAVTRWEWRIVPETLWWPGVLLFLAVTLPWYVLVQAHNPQFFEEFILRQNFARFSTDLYRHEYPWWYYAPVLLLSLMPWTVFALLALGDTLNRWRPKHGTHAEEQRAALRAFLVVWAVTPVLFFSISQSKLPGYILPALPAWLLLTSNYLRDKMESVSNLPKWLIGAQAVLMAALAAGVFLAPRLMLHRGEALPMNLMRTAGIVAAIVFAAVIILLDVSKWEMARFATLLPLVLCVAYVLKVAAPIVDATQSARPVARELASFAPNADICVSNGSRSLEYGLAFYRNRPVYALGWSAEERARCLLVTSLAKKNPVPPKGHRLFAGDFPAQNLGFWWVELQGFHVPEGNQGLLNDPGFEIPDNTEVPQ